MKRFVVPVTEELHRQVRVRAAQEGVVVTEVIRGFLEEWSAGHGFPTASQRIAADPKVAAPEPFADYTHFDEVGRKEVKAKFLKPTISLSKEAQVKGRSRG